MFKKRNALLLSLGLCTLLASTTDPGFLSHPRARHVKSTIFISAGNRRLAGFFEDLTPDPHWDADKLLRASRQTSGCQSQRNAGPFARLMLLLQVTVHAQNPCQTFVCANNWSSKASYSCPNCTAGWNTGSGSNYCSGTQYDGTMVCTGDGCSSQCNYTACDIPNCTCIETGGSCTESDTCCSSTASCLEGTCQDVF